MLSEEKDFWTVLWLDGFEIQGFKKIEIVSFGSLYMQKAS